MYVYRHLKENTSRSYDHMTAKLLLSQVVMAYYVAAINIVARAAVKQRIVMDLRLTSKIPYRLSYISMC